MQRHKSFVIAVSGPSGAGKTALVERAATLLGDATTLYYDSYKGVAHWHPDCRQWVEQGCNPNHWVSIPQLVADVRALRSGRAICLPEGQQIVDPAHYIILEEPWGRDRDELRPWIDFVVHIEIPLDISLCRKLLRDAGNAARPLDPLAFVQEYLTQRLGELYRRQQQVGAHADLVVDGMRSSDDVAMEVVEHIRRRQ